MSSRRFPLVNMSEDETHVYVDALMPGVDPNEAEVSLLRNTITLSGERKAPGEEKGQIIHRSELGFGKFSRTVEIPVDIDPNKVSAKYRDGIMRITLGKPETAKPKKIDIKLT
jgi:HSP20 family protein